MTNQKYKDIKQNPKVTFQEIHTSGHAVRKDLQRFATGLKPKRLVPVHTEKAADYSKWFDNVHILQDGVELQV